MNNNQTVQEYAIIVGSYTNACSIINGLKEIKFSGRILVVDATVDKAKCLVEVVYPDIDVIKKRVTELEEIIDIINKAVDLRTKKTVFMTSEEFIEPIRKALAEGRLQNTIAHTGSELDNDLIFDRLKFYQFVHALGINNIPRTIASENDPYKEFGEDFIVRVNKSWEGNKKLPRLKIVHSKEEKEFAEKQLLEEGLTTDMWSYQELLSTENNHNVSVCGWHESGFHQYAVTRKILQHPPKVGNGDVVEIYHDAPDYLISQTETILNALAYTGPFEMEYVLDMDSQEYKLIELNPRFWMQHGLIEKVTNYSLIRRAIGNKNILEIKPNEIEHLYWVNGNQAIYRICKGQFSIIKYLKDGICIPSIRKSLMWMLFYRKYVNECNGA